MYFRWSTAACLAVMALLLFGCASYTIDEPYRPTHERLSEAGNFSIYVQLRSELGSTPGVRIGDYGRRDIILGPPYDEWLASGLRGEYRRAGFRVADNPEDAPAMVDVQVVQVFAERASGCAPMVDCVGAVAVFDVEVVDPRTGNRYGRRFASSASSTTMSASAEDLEDRLREALAGVYEEIVSETHALLTGPPDV